MTFLEDSILYFFPRSKALRWQYNLSIPGYGYFAVSPLKLVNRTIVVCVTTLVVKPPA